MEEKTKSEIIKLREQDFGYKMIAKKLEINLNTIKSFCRRSGFGAKNKQIPINRNTGCCKNCGRRFFLEKKPGRKRYFCDEKCKNKYYYSVKKV